MKLRLRLAKLLCPLKVEVHGVELLKPPQVHKVETRLLK